MLSKKTNKIVNRKIAISAILTTLLTSSVYGAIYEDTLNSLTGVYAGSVAIDDLNGDGHNDILITGNDGTNTIAKIYLNDSGSGVFTEDTSNSLTGIHFSSVAIKDLNGDGHNDILISGEYGVSTKITKIYLNDSSGSGVFTEDTSNSLTGARKGSVAVADLNGDGHNDILISGEDSSFSKIAKIYLNNSSGSGVFTEDTSSSLTGVISSSVAISDLNSDGHNDILITGNDASNTRITKIYLNDGSGSGIFSEDTSNSLIGVASGSVAIDDLNGDGHNDILITGSYKNSAKTTKIYLNDSSGSGVFTMDSSNSLSNVYTSSVAIDDLNADGHNDILITGNDDTGANIAKIYLNDSSGSGIFSEDTSTSLTGVYTSSVAIKDLNSDGHNDILITGREDSTTDNIIAKIYLNDKINLSSVVNENRWNMISVPDEREVTASDITGATIWTFDNSSNAWEQPTTLKAGDGYWLYTTSTTDYNSISATPVSSTITDDYTTIKSINDNEWSLVGISADTDGISLADIYNPTNTLKDGCYSNSIFYYDSLNGTWNTIATIPYLGAVWAKQNCIN